MEKQKICKIVDCNLVVWSRELCSRHYNQFWQSDEFFLLPSVPKEECLFDGCRKRVQAKGYCSGHYKQLQEGRELKALKVLDGTITHGTVVGHQKFLCRCELCVTAYLEMRQRRNAWAPEYVAEYMVEFRIERLELASQIKLKSGCVDCGYNEHAEALEFDHIDTLNKTFEIGRAVRQRIAWHRVLEEIEKCEVRCVNCHRIKTVKQNRNPDTQYTELVMKRLALINQQKLDAGCIDCRYNFCVEALQFDHTDRKTKRNNVSTLLWGGYSWEVIQTEILKCEIRCANCHRMRSVAQKRNGEF